MSDPSRLRLTAGSPGIVLGLDADELAACVQCGLCLPHCPTFRVTGDEAASPRGRIAAMRLVEAGQADIDAAFERSMDTCVQCRGCEPACPSGVRFGALMEGTRAALASPATPVHYQPWWRRLGYRLLGHHRLLLAASSLLAIAQRLHLVPSALPRMPALPRLPVRRRPLDATGDDVWLFTGCVMDAWQRPIHAATVRVISAAGAGVRPTGAGAACCGALATHAGLVDIARQQAQRVVDSVPGDAAILVNSAGCGAQLKDYGHLLGTDEGARFAARVQDVHEWLAPRISELAPDSTARAVESGARTGYERVAVQDPCHLRHVQRCEQSVRDVLAPFVELVELDDEGLCCGAGGAYSATQPELAQAIRARKLEAIARAGAPVVASANPGCALHLAAAGVTVHHPMEILDAHLNGET